MPFPETRWTLILASRGKPELRERALAELLRIYWFPLYAFLRGKGLTREAAEDALQGFTLQLMERDVLSKLDPGRGRLRAFLKTALTNHLAHVREAEGAARRGGGQKLLTIDLDVAERTLASTAETPDAAYERAWAQQVMARALAKLGAEYQSGERSGPYEIVAQYFSGDGPEPYPVLAAKHGMSVPQLKSFLHRARGRFRTLLEEEVADTVATPEEVEAEMQELLRAL